VPEAGLEPARPLGTRDFKSLASTNSATPACLILKNIFSFSQFYNTLLQQNCNTYQVSL
jgi:hypothetical protein